MKTRFCLSFVILLSASSYAHAKCTSSKNVCYVIENCLKNGAQSDKDTIKAGISDPNPDTGGNQIWVGLDRCLRDYDNRHFGDVSYNDWTGYSGSCANGEYSTIGKAVRAKGPDFCRAYPD